MSFPSPGMPPFETYGKPTILVVDDEPEQVRLVLDTLSQLDYTCHTAGDFDSARQLARHVAPDLIVCDINLGGESGLELVEQLRTEHPLSDVPVLFISGAQIPDVIQRAHAVGGTYYVRKPFDPSVLLELVDKALWMPHLVSSRGQS